MDYLRGFWLPRDRAGKSGWREDRNGDALAGEGWRGGALLQLE